MENTICLFIHYDSENIYSEDDLDFIEKLSRIFSNVIVLTSNTDVVKNIVNVTTINNIPNIGFDFGKLEFFLETVRTDEVENLYVFNNSCLLVRDPSCVINYMNKKNFDFWGFTSSAELDLHIQSYFFYLNQKSIGVIKKFFEHYSPTKNKYSHEEVVMKLELPLLLFMEQNGVNCGSYLKTHLFQHTNSTIVHADKLLVLNPHFPFIKKKVFSFAKIYTREHLLSLV